MRAGEAKLRERVRDDAPQAKDANGGKFFASNHSSFIIDAIYMGIKD